MICSGLLTSIIYKHTIKCTNTAHDRCVLTMPKIATPLNDARIRSLKVKDKRYSVSDGGGLTLEVMTSSAKIWRFRYSLNSKQQPLLTIGDYPAIGLQDARKLARSYTEIVVRGESPVVDPAISQKQPVSNSRPAKFSAPQTPILAPALLSPHDDTHLSPDFSTTLRYIPYTVLLKLREKNKCSNRGEVSETTYKNYSAMRADLARHSDHCNSVLKHLEKYHAG